MAENIKDSIEYEKHVVSIDFESLKVKTSDGEKYQAQNIISTIPWIGIEELNGMPSSIKNEIKKLKHNSVQTSYYSEKLNTNAHWIYYPDPKLSYHRILVRHNFAMNMNSRGYWTETNSERINLQNAPSSFQYMNDYAYPLNTLEKPQIMSRLLEWTKSKNVFGLGRWGEHEHYNSDVTAGKAMDLADQLYSK
jgi:UDP-galactopyranose mutase